ncbi:hypothetical protein EV356DRAFT_509807 [Viridothelium virens]|uniref:Uncharacterized protein n=1 Tax=Viridothelium virens TaxID=1048519 RepID=A0A6A6HK96_VIRVR|nr:hypothetical protein EV356DRAFT_509807 [Viridothelium virens]
MMSYIDGIWSEIKALGLIFDKHFDIFRAVLTIFFRTRRTIPSYAEPLDAWHYRIRHLLNVSYVRLLFRPADVRSKKFTDRLDEMVDRLCILWNDWPYGVTVEGRQIYGSYMTLLRSSHQSLALQMGNELKKEHFFRATAKEAEEQVRNSYMNLPKPLVKFDFSEENPAYQSALQSMEPLEPTPFLLTRSEIENILDQTLEAHDWGGWPRAETEQRDD